MSQLLAAHELVANLGAWTDRPGPRYLRLAEAVQDLLARESTPAGCRLPAERALAQLPGMLVRPGDRVVVEAPTYPGAVELFSRAGASIVGLPRDHAGPRPDDLRHALSSMGAAFVFLIPTCHNPTGSVMHEQRR